MAARACAEPVKELRSPQRAVSKREIQKFLNTKRDFTVLKPRWERSSYLLKAMLRLIKSKAASLGKILSARPPNQISTKRLFSSRAQPDNFLHGSNSVYVEQMYDSWLSDPKR